MSATALPIRLTIWFPVTFGASYIYVIHIFSDKSNLFALTSFLYWCRRWCITLNYYLPQITQICAESYYIDPCTSAKFCGNFQTETRLWRMHFKAIFSPRFNNTLRQIFAFYVDTIRTNITQQGNSNSRLF